MASGWWPDAIEGSHEPGHWWQCSADGNDCGDYHWHGAVLLKLLPQRGFPLFRPFISGKYCSVLCCRMGHTFALPKRAEHGNPGARVSLFRRLVVPGTRSCPTPAVHLRIPYAGVILCFHNNHMKCQSCRPKPILDRRARRGASWRCHSRDYASLMRHVLRTRSLTHDSLPDSAKRAKAYLLYSRVPVPKVDALSLELEILPFRLPCTFPRISVGNSLLSLYNPIPIDRSQRSSFYLEVFFPDLRFHRLFSEYHRAQTLAELARVTYA